MLDEGAGGAEGGAQRHGSGGFHRAPLPGVQEVDFGGVTAEVAQRRGEFGAGGAPGGAERYGELTADPVSDTVDETPTLLVMLRVLGDREPVPEAPAARVTPMEAHILALLAGAPRRARAAREAGLTVDRVNHHLRRLSARWNSANRAELVARGYAPGVLVAGVWPPRPAAPDGPE
ncbi:hypothetical protein [Streptomyces sp. UG1]|uniref:hypothetical protein n=1 Tax=Streptomyces sp. UG1 TaxID=3417652 RepID=UPI003CF3AA82